MGALSKKEERIPVNQKYIKSIGLPLLSVNKLIINPKSPFFPVFKIAIAGIIVIKIPAKSLATSLIGSQVKPFSFLICAFVIFILIPVIIKSKILIFKSKC